MARITEKTRPGQPRIRALRQSAAQLTLRNKGSVGGIPRESLSWIFPGQGQKFGKKKSPMTNIAKPIDSWFQYDHVLDLADGTEDILIVIGSEVSASS